MNFDAIIFDCDGTLVDSEVLGIQVLIRYASELGLHYPLHEAIKRFTGGKMANSIATIETHAGRKVPEDFVPELRRRMADVFAEKLQAVPGVEEVIRSLEIPFCVASSGPREKIELTLTITGLRPYFADHIFSAYEVGHWKPDPGLFLHAARALGVKPERCAVVEDSLYGVQAGKAAGMTVFGYVPSGNDLSLSQAGATITFANMTSLLTLLQEHG